MKRLLTADDVLSDIEFEIMQGALARDDIGESIVAVRQFQQRLRADTFESRKQPDWRAMLSRQFQLNEMLITLLQELAAQQRATQFQSTRTAARPLTSAIVADTHSNGNHALPPSLPFDDPVDKPARETIEARVQTDALTQEMDARPNSLPLVGALLTRLRLALHSLTLFYVNRLAVKQTSNNRALADAVLQLSDVVQQQQDELASLRAQLDARGSQRS